VSLSLFIDVTLLIKKTCRLAPFLGDIVHRAISSLTNNQKTKICCCYDRIKNIKEKHVMLEAIASVQKKHAWRFSILFADLLS